MNWDPVIDQQTSAHPEIVALLHKRLSDLKDGFRQNVALLGAPGSGKSSALLTAIAQSRALPLLIVYCEARREPWELWARRFLWATLHGLAGFRPEQIDATHEATLLRKAYAIAPRTAQSIAELLPQIRVTPHERVFRQILDLPYLAIEETKRPGVIVLDEFHQLERLGVYRPFHELGKRIMLERSMLYLFASSQPVIARRILRERLNLLFGGFELVELDGMSAAAGEALIRDRLSHRRLPEWAAGFLVRFTNGHPWSLATLLDAFALRGQPACIDVDCGDQAHILPPSVMLVRKVRSFWLRY